MRKEFVISFLSNQNNEFIKLRAIIVFYKCESVLLPSVEGFSAVSQGKVDRELLKTSAFLGLQPDRLSCIGKVFCLASILLYEGAFVNISFLYTVFSRTQEI